MGARVPNGEGTFYDLGGWVVHCVGGKLLFVVKHVDDLDHSDTAEALQEDVFLVHVVK